jgi:hypothetical protein
MARGKNMKGAAKRSDETHYYDEWARKTSLFQEWEAMKEDVLRHKWFESERAGRDVGWDRAVVDYNVRVRPKRPPRPRRPDPAGM